MFDRPSPGGYARVPYDRREEVRVHERRRTATSNFGVTRRENHDASAFYERFRPPDVSDDDTVLPPTPVAEPFVHGDARSMDAVADGSVALVVTSPPYFAGKTYEEELEREGVPSSYLEYLELLHDVFAECVRKLEPGGRIAVNVANLGRKPYRSLSADVIRILQDLGLLLRGELIWQKGPGNSGSCAWGSFRSAANPVLRDITERVVVASRGRFDRAQSIKDRRALGLPHANTLMAEDFMALTLDVWDIPPESARRVGHPAPFPVELPEQLIRLYTFEDDLVLDPFMGSGSALVAAAGLRRRYIGYDTDEDYVNIARRRVDEARRPAPSPTRQARRRVVPRPDDARGDDDFQSRATREGKRAQQLAEDVLVDAGFTITDRNTRIPRTGVTVNFIATDANGRTWFFDVSGAFKSHRGGLLRTDTVWKSLGRAAALRGGMDPDTPLVFLTTSLPRRPSEGDTALRSAGPGAFFDAIGMLSDDDRARLERYAAGWTGPADEGFWTRRDLAPRPT
jgi:site-specific DNA-methyltransferase (adenine-specific)